MEVKRQSLLRLVEERAMAKKAEEEKRKQESEAVPYLPLECVSAILLRLPLGALHRSIFVCKPWLDTVSHQNFVLDHLRRSHTVFIFTSPPPPRDRDAVASIFPENPNSVSVEAKLHEPSSAIILERPLVRRGSKLLLGFAEVGDDGRARSGEYGISCLGEIRAACDGLILLDNTVKRGGVVVMNPVTRKLSPLPLGTLSAKHNESYGFVPAAGGYKVAHLFRDSMGHDNCEVIDVGARSWREIDGPGLGLIGWFGYDPVQAIGALHWVPHIDRSDYLVSMEVDAEKFRQTELPKSGRAYDRVVELNGHLAFVTHEGLGRIDVWVLKGLSNDDLWTKQHTITRGSVIDMVAFCSSRVDGDLVFKRDEKRGLLYFYSFKLGKMTEVSMAETGVPFPDIYFPHVNSLVSW